MCDFEGLCVHMIAKHPVSYGSQVFKITLLFAKHVMHGLHERFGKFLTGEKLQLH